MLLEVAYGPRMREAPREAYCLLASIKVTDLTGQLIALSAVMQEGDRDDALTLVIRDGYGFSRSKRAFLFAGS